MAKRDAERSGTDVARAGCIMVGREDEGLSCVLAADSSWNYVLWHFL
jgi:hypothetical protein